MNKYQEIVELAQQLNDLRIGRWTHDILFSPNWWILFCITIGLLIVWLFILDKKRVMEIVAYGFMVAITGVMGDIIGVSMVLWQYPYSLFPISIIASIHVIMMPVIYMIVYQCSNNWKAFLLAATLNAFVFAFILEPILVWLQIYDLIEWQHRYSFVPYILIAVVFKWLTNQFKRLDQHYNRR